MESGAAPLTILFDIDETLVFAVDQTDHRWTPEVATEVGGLSFDTVAGEMVYHVVVRPYARQLLENCARKYRVGFFTAAERIYAEPIIQQLLSTVAPDMCFFRDSCKPDVVGSDNGPLCKELTSLQLGDLSRVIVLDNLAPSNILPEANGLFCPPFEVYGGMGWSDLRKDKVLESYETIINYAAVSGDVLAVVQRANTMMSNKLSLQ